MMRGPIDRFFVLNLFRITIPIRGAQKQRYSISHDGARQMEKKVNSKNGVSMSHLISDSELIKLLYPLVFGCGNQHFSEKCVCTLGWREPPLREIRRKDSSLPDLAEAPLNSNAFFGSILPCFYHYYFIRWIKGW